MSQRVAPLIRRRGVNTRAAAGDARGQGLVEYILILSLIAIVALVALSFFGSQLSDLLSTIASQINP
jgi:Flp pilus assembly pilin Flp